MTTHEFTKAYQKKLLETGYKSFSLFSLEGEKLITFNTGKGTANAKLIEIEKRLNSLPNGIYILQALFSSSMRTKPDIIYLNKGKVSEAMLSETPIILSAPKEKQQAQPLPMAANKELSLEKTLERIEEAASLRAENIILKSQVNELQKTIADLEAQLDEAESATLQEQPDKVKNWLSEIMPVLSPVADEFFKLQNRKLTLEEYKLLRETNPKKARTMQRQAQQKKIYDFDINNLEALNKFFNYLDNLPEQNFEQLVAEIEVNAPALYMLIEREFFEEEEEEEEESEETQE